MAALLLRTAAVASARLLQGSAASRSLVSWLGARGPAGAPFLARFAPPGPQPAAGMKCKTVLRKRCKDCFFVRRRGRLCVYCKTHPRHKQRQL